MRATAFRTLQVSVLVLGVTCPAWSWGHQAHQMVNALAVENLSEPLRSYFRGRKAYFVEHASDPDELGHEDPAEGPHHYTDADANDRYPFPKLRREFLDQRRGPTAIERQHGDSIWQIESFTLKMAAALRRRQWDEADRAAVFAAHYACDLTQPLHTTQDYDGQSTRQAGIHSRFETELVNALKAGWILKPQAALNELDLRARIFRELLASHRERDAVFAADRKAVAGRSYVDPQYFPAFEKLAGPLAEKRLEAAISFVSSLWYTAWVRAGRPVMPSATGQWRPAADVPGLSGWERHTAPSSSPCGVSARIRNEAETDRSGTAAGGRDVGDDRCSDVPFHAPSGAAGFAEEQCSRSAAVRRGGRLRRFS